jgi:3-carboxy-cis,cis-muconate cycloisomerase
MIYSKYLSDIELKAICSDENFISKMLQVEIALAKVQANIGIIPKEAAKEIETVLKDIKIPPETLADGMLKNGVPTIPMLKIVKQYAEIQNPKSEIRNYIHFGATSQDIIDTAHILMYQEAILIFEKRILKIIDFLKKLAEKHQDTLTIARTRTQQAVPIFFSQKIGDWYKPLERHLERLKQLKERLLVVQFGGAGGNLSALGDKGIETATHLAKALNLKYIGTWHSQRDNIAEFSAWMALVTGSFGKMAQDILLMASTEVGEVIENSKGGGKSSTMPHKNNPILSEAIVALSRMVGNLVSNNFQAMLHNHERDAAAWILEWQAMPQMMTGLGAILSHALTISEHIEINKKAIQTNLEKTKGLVFSEKASFELTKYMPRSEAKKAVGEACKIVMEENIHLEEALKQLFPNIEISIRF